MKRGQGYLFQEFIFISQRAKIVLKVSKYNSAKARTFENDKFVYFQWCPRKARML